MGVGQQYVRGIKKMLCYTLWLEACHPEPLEPFFDKLTMALQMLCLQIRAAFL